MNPVNQAKNIGFGLQKWVSSAPISTLGIILQKLAGFPKIWTGRIWHKMRLWSLGRGSFSQAF